MRLVTDCVARKLRSQLLEYKHDFNIALMDYDDDPQTFKLHQQQAEFMRQSIVGELMPWADAGPKTLQEASKLMRKEYNRRFADPASEKGRAAIAKQLRIWEEQRRGKGRSGLSKRKHNRKRSLGFAS